MSRVKSTEKREIMLNSAKSLFLKEGFAGTSMDKVSQAAGVSKNTLYSHFSNKKELFAAVLKAHWQSESVPQLSAADGRPIAEVLSEFSQQVMQYLYQENTMALFRILIAESARFPDLAQSLIEGDSAPILLSLTQFLTTRLANSVDAKAAAISYFGLLKEDAFWHVLAGFRKPYNEKELAQRIELAVATFTNYYSLK
jgi:TetR/AcrR family transcriptional repressor of mexJK operon